MNSNLYKDYKLSKIKLINKLKRFSKGLKRAATDENAFISINDFLADEHSLGPKADPGSIYYRYTDFENINWYIKILMKDLDFLKIVCIPNYYIEYNYTLDYLLFNDTLINAINKCTSKRFIYIILKIFGEQIAHANMIIIDNLKKTIERFEPHGHYFISAKSIDNDKNLDNKFNKNLLKILNLNDYKYISPIDISPKMGVQVKADAYEGMCVSYSLIYLQLRLMNPDIDQKIIVNYLKSKETKDIIDIILKYARYVEKKLKENEDFIFEDQMLIHKQNKNIHKYIIIDDNGTRTIEK